MKTMAAKLSHSLKFWDPANLTVYELGTFIIGVCYLQTSTSPLSVDVWGYWGSRKGELEVYNVTKGVKGQLPVLILMSVSLLTSTNHQLSINKRGLNQQQYLNPPRELSWESSCICVMGAPDTASKSGLLEFWPFNALLCQVAVGLSPNKHFEHIILVFWKLQSCGYTF